MIDRKEDSLKKVVGLVVAGVLCVSIEARESLFFVGAHPDDSEGFAATAFLLRDAYDIHIVDLTRGELGLGKKGLEDGTTAKRRVAEEQAACAYLGATPHFLAEVDGSAYAGRQSVEILAKLIDELKPRAVFTHWPVDSHVDHVQTAAVAMNAIRFSKHKPERYFFEVQFGQTENFYPTYSIDVTSTISNKIEMLKRYVCQGGENELWKNNYARAKQHGEEGGLAFAELFATYDGKPVKGGVLEPLKKVVWGRPALTPNRSH